VQAAGVRTVSGNFAARIHDPKPGANLGKVCPVCGQQGRRVTSLTVTVHLRPEFWTSLGDGFWFCWTRECPIFYYDNGRELHVSKDPREVRSRFGLKETEAPRPICYCLGVNAERIFDEVEQKDCCDSLEDVERYTRAGTGKWCVTTNPSGVCCRAYLKDIVAESLARASTKSRRPVQKVADRLEADKTPGTPTTLKVSGMDCEACGFAVAGLIEHEGGRNVRVSVADGRAQLELPRGAVLSKLLTSLAEAGYASELGE
jgi:copper chaperone CopZ